MLLLAAMVKRQPATMAHRQLLQEVVTGIKRSRTIKDQRPSRVRIKLEPKQTLATRAVPDIIKNVPDHLQSRPQEELIENIARRNPPIRGKLKKEATPLLELKVRPLK